MSRVKLASSLGTILAAAAGYVAGSAAFDNAMITALVAILIYTLGAWAIVIAYNVAEKIGYTRGLRRSLASPKITFVGQDVPLDMTGSDNQPSL